MAAKRKPPRTPTTRPKRRGAPRLSLAASSRHRSSTPTQTAVAVVERFFAQIPETELAEALDLSDDVRAVRLAEVIRDPAYDPKSFASRCRAASISPLEVLDKIVAMHHSDAALRVARRLPGILESMAIEAEPHEVVCACVSDGASPKLVDVVAGTFTADPSCRKCRGAGYTHTKADNDVRKMVLETQGLLGNRGPANAFQFNFGGGGGGKGRDGGSGPLPDMSDWSRDSDPAFGERVGVGMGVGVGVVVVESSGTAPGTSPVTDAEIVNE